MRPIYVIKDTTSLTNNSNTSLSYVDRLQQHWHQDQLGESKKQTPFSSKQVPVLGSNQYTVAQETTTMSSPTDEKQPQAIDEANDTNENQEKAERTKSPSPPLPTSSPPASPSKEPVTSSLGNETNNVSNTTTISTTINKTPQSTSPPSTLDKRSYGTNKLVSSQPISYTNAIATTASTSLANTSPYKSNISPRPTVISRRMDRSLIHSGGGSAGGPSSSGAVNFSSYPIAMKPTHHGVAQSAAGMALRDARQNEKKQLSELNDRFAGYVERVRFLEAQNKKLQIELDVLKSKWGQETKYIEKMYQIELEEARNVLNDTAKTKDSLQVKLDRNEQDLEEMRKKYFEVESLLNKDKEKIGQLQDQIASNESEIGLLRRRLNDLQDEEKRYKAEAQRMASEIQRVSFELECEIKQRLSLENDKQSLEEELLFLKEIHSKEIEELKHLSLKESGIDPSTFFKSELSTAIKEIREEYESLNQSQRNELEGWYRMKVDRTINEIQRKNAQALTSSRANETEYSREQAKKLKQQITDSKKNIGDLRAKNAELESRIRDLEDEIKREDNDSRQVLSTKEMEIQMLKEELNKIVNEYDDLMATKSDLEVEIRTYRKLLEGEENRDGLRQIVETIEHRARALGPIANSGYGSDRDSSPVVRSSVASRFLNSRAESASSSPSRRFGGLLPISRSHDVLHENTSGNTGVGNKKKSHEPPVASPFRRSILEAANETADDSSAAEDNDHHHYQPQQPSSQQSNQVEHGTTDASNANADGTADDEKEFGQILISVHYDSLRMKLVVKIVQATKLINTDKDSLSDPYARIILLPDRKKRTKRKTKIIKDSLAPQWEEQFEYDMTLVEAKAKTIDVSVKNDKSLFSREKTFMGKCLINLDEIENLEIGSAEWYKLQSESVFASALKKINYLASNNK